MINEPDITFVPNPLNVPIPPTIKFPVNVPPPCAFIPPLADICPPTLRLLLPVMLPTIDVLPDMFVLPVIVVLPIMFVEPDTLNEPVALKDAVTSKLFVLILEDVISFERMIPLPAASYCISKLPKINAEPVTFTLPPIKCKPPCTSTALYEEPVTTNPCSKTAKSSTLSVELIVTPLLALIVKVAVLSIEISAPAAPLINKSPPAELPI